MKALETLKLLSEITAYQWGMFTTAQAERLGISRDVLARLTRYGQTERLLQGVYRVTVDPTDVYEELRAVWLKFIPQLYAYERIKHVENDFVVSGKTAAVLHGMADYRLDRFEFTHKGRHQTRLSQVDVRNRSIDPAEVVIVEGLPVKNQLVTYRDLMQADEDMSSVRCEAEF